MTLLDKYLEQIEVAGESLEGKAFKAYRMDGGRNKPDMRTDIGLGTCHCCDYFKIRIRDQEEVVVLIEETQLMETLKNYKEEYDTMVDEKKKKEFLSRRVIDANILKVYGSLFTLCHGAAKYKELSDLVAGKKHDFWLVASDGDEHDASADEDISKQISQDLQSMLHKDLIGEVELLTTSQLKSVLSNDAAPS